MQPLPIPGFLDSSKADQIWRVPYQQRFEEALLWARQHNVPHHSQDRFRIAVLPIDCQITFCLPGSELFVGGRSGNAAVEDNIRLAEFVYRNLGVITGIFPTMDTHLAMQIFHPVFLIDQSGNHPAPATIIENEDVQSGKWSINPAVAASTGNNLAALSTHLRHYSAKLSEGGKYPLMIWPFHAMLGGIGHALAPIAEEAFFFHNIARGSQTGYEIKGGNPLTENYSVLAPEVLVSANGKPIAQRNTLFIQKLLSFDAVVILGQAKSHCVAWTIDDLLDDIMQKDPSLAKKVYLVEDCTSPVVIPNVVDFTDQADAAFTRFADAGMNVVKSTDPIESWPGIRL